MSLSTQQRKLFIDFLSVHACDDIIIQVMNRVTNNIEDTKALETYVAAFNKLQPKTAEQAVKTITESVEKFFKSAPEPTTDSILVDLGPACAKLGSNGQAIQKLLESEHRVVPISLTAICQRTRLPASKVKPMLALLIQRKQALQRPDGFVATITI